MIRSLKKRRVLFLVLLIAVVGLLLPQHLTNPVDKADNKSYNAKSFWFYPWGKSGTHKGVDIFAREGTTVRPSTSGLVVFKGEIAIRGNVVLILGPRWRLHYYAHLKDINASTFTWVSKADEIGTVGTTGNAKGKPAHLHYSIVTLIPYPWRIDNDEQGWKKMFYLNPSTYLNE